METIGNASSQIRTFCRRFVAPKPNTVSRFLRAAALSLSLVSVALGPSYAAGLGSAAAKAAAKSAGSAATKGAVKSSGRPKDVVIRREKHPEAAAHIDEAQRLGEPTVLTMDRKNAAARRQEALRVVPRNEKSPTAKDRDEYPPAITKEGGANSSVRYIDAGDNRGAGKSIEHQARDVPDGERIRVLVQ